MTHPLLALLAQRVVLFDGAMGTQLQAANLTNEDFLFEGEAREGCNELLNLTRPEVVAEIHKRYFDSGADIVETNTFGNLSYVLGEFGLAHMDRPLAFEAAKIANSVKRPGQFVAGAIGPGTKLISLGQVSFDEVYETYLNSFLGLIEGGVDFLMLETQQDLLVTKAGVIAAAEAMGSNKLPLLVSLTMEQTGTMLLGTELEAAICALEALPAVTLLGINCATGPQEMVTHVRTLSKRSQLPFLIMPNAGLPVMEEGRACYKLTPDELAEHQLRFITENGASLIGGCCGTTPDHIRALAKLKELQPVQRNLEPLVGCASLYQFQPYQQDASFLIVGERTNANGSKAFREQLALNNWEALVEIAREQEAEGAHLLDVCVAYVGRDEQADMHALASRINTQVTLPIVIDSTEVAAIEVALKALAGKPMINSINFEDGEARASQITQLARKYGAGLVALTIDENGMAKSRAEKVRIASRLIEFTRSYGIADADLFIDCLTFTLGSGDEEFRMAGVETLSAIKDLKQQYPEVNTILGVSNISFGLKPAARQVLNSVFLHEALACGLSSAIVHFSKILPEPKVEADLWQIANDLVYDRRDFLPVG